MNNVRIWVGLLFFVAVGGMLTASAGDFTGDPAADGWSQNGNSLADGTYIRGAGIWAFYIYGSAFQLSSCSPMVNGTSWRAGDQVLGLGGEMSAGQFLVARLVAKFGAVGALFSPSTVPPPDGDGHGSFSGGDAGLGGVQVDYVYHYTGTNVNAGQNGVILVPDHVLYYNGASVTTNSNFARVLALFQRDAQGQDILQTFEVLLNLSALSDPTRGHFGSQVPILYGKGDMAVQYSTDGDYTDAYMSQIIPKLEFFITAIQLLGSTNALVSFNSISCATHELQRRDDLVTNSWLTVTNNIPGTGGIIQVKDSFVATQQKRFYRVKATY